MHRMSLRKIEFDVVQTKLSFLRFRTVATDTVLFQKSLNLALLLIRLIGVLIDRLGRQTNRRQNNRKPSDGDRFSADELRTIDHDKSIELFDITASLGSIILLSRQRQLTIIILINDRNARHRFVLY